MPDACEECDRLRRRVRELEDSLGLIAVCCAGTGRPEFDSIWEEANRALGRKEGPVAKFSAEYTVTDDELERGAQ